MKVFSRIFQDAELLAELREAAQMKNKNAVLLLEWASVSDNRKLTHYQISGMTGSRPRSHLRLWTNLGIKWILFFQSGLTEAVKQEMRQKVCFHFFL